MISQRPQPAYDPMAQMMQRLQLVLSQNQQAQQQANQDRGFKLDQQQLAMRDQQFNSQMQLQQEEMKQREQRAIMAALSRAMPQTAMGMDDPTALYAYLQNLGVQVPMQAQQPAEDPQVTAAKAQWAAMQQKLLQQ